MAAYTVVIDQTGGFALEIQGPDNATETIEGFKTKAGVPEWLNERQKIDQTDAKRAT
jgi:hypothetical protein